ncbi:MAG: metallophosphoesterase [Proteobacteria bacterium]|nr:metallophosphoesterase [Pseudomonadota bacterium]
MRLLLFSDIHRDADAARSVVECSADADVLVCAGDLAVMREGLQKPVDILAAAAPPTVLVAGNGESDEELAAACAIWRSFAKDGDELAREGLKFIKKMAG